jgi:hypothetical protein
VSDFFIFAKLANLIGEGILTNGFRDILEIVVLN